MVAVEAKFSSAPAVTKGFWNAFRDLSCRRGFVLYPGNERYPLGQGVDALPLSHLGALWDG